MRFLAGACLVAVSGSMTSAAAAAETHQLNLPAGKLGNALIALGRQAGISIGISDAELANQRVGAVRGRLSVNEALNRLLRGKNARVVRIDSSTIRVVRQSPPPQVPKPPPPPPAPPSRIPAPTVEPQGPEMPSQDILVTGSRIQRPDLISASPITIIDDKQIALTGTSTVETLLNDFPQFIAGENRTSNNSGGLPFPTLDLRGLGPQRTLILVDGERLPLASVLGVVDISQIPVGLIERIEVVTGGATAVYGSDAMAGLVNFILKKDFEGVELAGQLGASEEGVGLNYSVAGLLGGSFADDRGNMILYASYFAREASQQSRFDFSRVSQAIYYDPSVGRAYPVDSYDDIVLGSYSIFAGGSATGSSGTAVNNPANPFRNLSNAVGGEFVGQDADCDAATGSVNVDTGSLSFDPVTGALQPYNGGGNCQIPIGNSSLYNYAPANFLTLPYERFNLSSTARYEFTSRTRGELFASFTNWTSRTQLAATPAAGAEAFVVDPATAQYIPADLRAALDTRPNPDAPFLFGRRFSEAGLRLGQTESQAIIGRVTLEHELGDGWLLSGDLGWGRSVFTSRNRGSINRVAVEQGINGCGDRPGLLPGCVPVDIFGPNTLTPEMLGFIRTETIDVSRFDQVRASANLAGSMFRLPGGPAGIAVGAEVRKDSGRHILDDAKQRGEVIGFAAQNSISGEIGLKEIYGELRLPILGGGGFPDLLAVELGARYSDYSTLRGLFNWKAAVEFAPVRWARLRGAFNKAVRAPNFFELFRAGDEALISYIDPCNLPPVGVPDNRPAQCAADIPAAAYPAFSQSSPQVLSFSYGQPNLEEEKAKTYTAGVVLTPSLFPLGRVSLTADYYDITITNRIGALGAGQYLIRCYSAFSDAVACARIVRDPASGQVVRIDTGFENGRQPLRTSGIDVGMNWTIPLADLLGGSLGRGRITVNELFSYTMDYKYGGVDYVDTVGFGEGVGYSPVSRWSSIFSLGYERDRFQGQIRWVHKSGGSQEEAMFGPGIRHDRIPDLNTVDLSLKWDVSDRFSLTGMVHNLLDEYPPRTLTGTLEQSNTNAAFYSPIILGRSYAVQARVRF